MSAIEMMINQALKGLGIEPGQIAELATALSEGIADIRKSNAKIISQNHRILMGLRALGYEEEEEAQTDDASNDSGDGPGNGGSGSDGNRDGGTVVGSVNGHGVP